MAFLGQVSRILLSVRADTTDARRKLKGLQGEQKKMAAAAIASQDAMNDRLEAQILKLGKVAIAIGVAAAAFKTLSGAAQRYADISQKELAASGANIENIQAAAGGLITRYEALSFAAAAMNTDFALNQKEMEAVAKAFVSLRNQGNALNRTLDQFTKAVVEGNVRGLREFGVILDERQGTLEAHRAIMARIAEENEKAGSNVSVAGDEALRAGVKWKDAIDKLVVALGKVAVALAPVVEGTAYILEGAIGHSTKGRTLKYARQAILQEIAQLQKFRKFSTNQALTAAFDEAIAKRRKLEQQLKGKRPPGPPGIKTIPPTPQKPPGGSRFEIDAATIEAGRRGFGAGDSAFVPSDATRAQVAHRRFRRERGGETAGSIEAAIDELLFPEKPLSDIAIAAEKATGKSFEDFDEATKKKIKAAEQFREQLALHKSIVDDFAEVGVNAMEQFKDAGVAGFDAWITGAKSVGEAIKESIGGALRGIANEMFGRALYHGAMALGSLAIGGPLGGKAAAAHGKAAAAFAGGAVVVGALAKGFGAGGAGSAGASGAAAGGGAATAAAGAGGSNITVFVGEDFGENPKQNGLRLGRAFRRAREAEGSDDEFFLNG